MRVSLNPTTSGHDHSIAIGAFFTAIVVGTLLAALVAWATQPQDAASASREPPPARVLQVLAAATAPSYDGFHQERLDDPQRNEIAAYVP